MNPLKCMIGLQTFAAVLEKESGKLHWSLFFIVTIFFLLTFALQPSCPKKMSSTVYYVEFGIWAIRHGVGECFMKRGIKK